MKITSFMKHYGQILAEMNEPRRMIRHVRHPFQPDKLIGTVVAVEKNGQIKLGYAQCHPKDQFSKKLGVKIATGRTGMTITNGPVPLTLYRWDGTKVKVPLVAQALHEIYQEACRKWVT